MRVEIENKVNFSWGLFFQIASIQTDAFQFCNMKWASKKNWMTGFASWNVFVLKCALKSLNIKQSLWKKKIEMDATVWVCRFCLLFSQRENFKGTLTIAFNKISISKSWLIKAQFDVLGVKILKVFE